MNIQQLVGSGGLPQTAPAAPRAVLPDSPPPPASPPGQEQVQRAVEQIQRIVSKVAHNLLFTVDQGTGRTIIRVVDSQTNEVIRQMPSEEVLAIAHALDQMQGLLFNGTA